MPSLLIVESPNKAKTIRTKYLPEGSRITVDASVGHFCDLRVDDLIDRVTWDDHYVIDPERSAKISKWRADFKSGTYDTLIVATDPDREGEAIAWHLIREIKPPKGVAVQRVRFNEITKKAVAAALAAPSTLDEPKVSAARARRQLDRVVGYDASSVARRIGGKSAGRVQTPCLHLLCVREDEIDRHVAKPYWTVSAKYSDELEAVLTTIPTAATDAALAEDATEQTDEEAHAAADEKRSEAAGVAKPKAYKFRSAADAATWQKALTGIPHRITAVKSAPMSVDPLAPYTTNSYVQDAVRVGSISTERAMQIAQTLFELGLITYHRTDSTTLAPDSVTMLRERIMKKHPEVLPAVAPVYKSRDAAQEGHEAIRPTMFDEAEAILSQIASGDQELARKIWRMIAARTLASQCIPAVYERTRVTFTAAGAELAAFGRVLITPGYLVYWRPYVKDTDETLPPCAAGEDKTPASVETRAAKDAPPVRYNESRFAAKLEKVGVGRPSTLGTIVQKLMQRGYVERLGTGPTGPLKPTALGRKVDGLMTASAPPLVVPAYTADMEAALDDISAGRRQRIPYLAEEFYPPFVALMAAASERATVMAAAMTPEERAAAGGPSQRPIGKQCPGCDVAELVEVTYVPKGKSKSKKFVGCSAKCGFSQDAPDTAWKVGGCPTCQGTLVERPSQQVKGETYWRCAKCKASANATGAPRTYVKSVSPAGCPRCATHPGMRRMTPTASAPEGRRPFDTCDACKLLLDTDLPWGTLPCPGCGGVLVAQTNRSGEQTGWRCVAETPCPPTTPATAMQGKPAGAPGSGTAAPKARPAAKKPAAAPKTGRKTS